MRVFLFCGHQCVVMRNSSINIVTCNHQNLRVFFKPFFNWRMKQDALTYEFGDGGLHDNSGFLALVQRKASKVVPRWLKLGSWEAGGPGASMC